jgi:hypothetical protein
VSISSGLSIERVVTLLTPIFAAGAAMLAGWLSTKLGVKVDAATIEGVMAAAFLGSVGIVYKWLHGRQIPEVAGLNLSSTQVDQVREQVAHHLAAQAPAIEADVDAIAQKVLSRIAQGVTTPAPPVASPTVAPASAPPA